MTDKYYTKLILGHIGIGFCIFLFPFLAKLYAVLIAVAGFYFIFKNKNKNNEALYASAYVVGCEVFLRTTFGNPFHEYGKYFVLLFVLLGLFYNGISKKTYPYWIFLLLLIPSTILAINNFNTETRRHVFFNIIGPICLGICSIYAYKRKISRHELDNILLGIGLPIVSSCIFLLLKYPLNGTVIDNTESNFFLSGNYAPNQMATSLGLGLFVFVLRFLTASKTLQSQIINALIIVLLYYRGLLTFSRGGMITGMAMIGLLLLLIWISHRKNPAVRLKLGLLFLLFPLVFALTSFRTNHLLFKRYNNQNPSGLYKSREVNGREDIALEEIQIFRDNPMTGIGVGKTKEQRKIKNGNNISSHNEITRMLAEHGVFGILSILILILTPLPLYLKDKQNFYLVCFFAFWLLTINHSGMRVAAPSFIYALALFCIKNDDEANLA
ncbi:O-antigen ligase family protein [Flavobacterium terrisoli]|uniref:O-antigen ligase family protein n=1 Tax=Flavobacterium terrisoli TaxID=3242195 RepID=UPI00254336AC|nr:O-antigen ligase family protein [Flavobacterium buctense]